MRWLRQLVDTVPPQRPGFDPMLVHVTFVVGKITKRQIFLQGCLFFLFIIMPSMAPTLIYLPQLVCNHINWVHHYLHMPQKETSVTDLGLFLKCFSIVALKGGPAYCNYNTWFHVTYNWSACYWPVTAICVVSSRFNLIELWTPRFACSGIPKEKVCGDTAIELDVQPKAQWMLLRPPHSSELQPPLSPTNPLMVLPDCLPTPGYESRQDDPDSDERWLSQVEIVTHAGPHRRLWMGPQFTFKTYNSPASGCVTEFNHVWYLFPLQWVCWWWPYSNTLPSWW